MAYITEKVAVCDVCGFKWIPRTRHPSTCASQKCRSRLWNSGGVDARTKEGRRKAEESRNVKRGSSRAKARKR